jgi:hypothetical protein
VRETGRNAAIAVGEAGLSDRKAETGEENWEGEEVRRGGRVEVKVVGFI